MRKKIRAWINEIKRKRHEREVRQQKEVAKAFRIIGIAFLIVGSLLGEEQEP